MLFRSDQQKMDLYGVQTADAEAVMSMAIGGQTASQLFEGERKFDIRVRFQQPFRKSEAEIGNLMVPTMNGTKIPIKEIAVIKSYGSKFDFQRRYPPIYCRKILGSWTRYG